MPITIRELLASDTISQAADKINFNFDQLLLNGGGPQGPQGPQGPPGPIGGRGIRGSIWYEDTSTTSPGNNPNTVPPTLTPENEDNYLQFNGIVWTYDASIPAWVPTNIDLTGPVGPPGASGKFAEYQALPYTAAGDTTIFPDRMSAASEDALNQAVRSVLIGGFPENIYNPTPSIPVGTNIVPESIAQSLVKNSYTMMIHQFDSNDTALVFHGGDVTEDFEQVAIQELSYIKLQKDDALRIVSPKARTGSNAFPGIYIEASNRAIDLDAGRELTIRTGTANSSDNYAGQDNFTVQVARSVGNSAEPYASISTIVSGQEAELKIGQTSTPTTTTTNSGNLVGLAGRISLIGTNAMNLRTTTDITIDAGTSIDIDATNNIDVTSNSGDISLSATSGEFSSTSQTVDVDATDSITVDAGTSIEIDASTFMRLTSTTSTEVFSAGDIDIHSKDADVKIYTDTGTGGANALSPIELITNGDNSEIKLETIGDKAPINLITNDDDGDIKLETIGDSAQINLITGTGSSHIVLDANNGGAIPSNIAQGGLRAYSLLRSQGNFYIGAGTGSYAFPGAPFTNKIVLEAQDDIELRANGTGGSILLQSGGNTSSIDLQRSTGTSIVNVFSTSGQGAYFRVWTGADNTTDGIGVSSFASGYSTIDALGATDKLIIQGWDQTATATGGGQSLGFEVSGTIDVDGNDQINAALDEKIFSSGTFRNDSVGDFGTVVINWIRVGNVITGSGIGSGWVGTGTFATIDAPITGPGGLIANVYGLQTNDANGESGPVRQGFTAGTIRLQTPTSFGAGTSYYFTFSYRLI